MLFLDQVDLTTAVRLVNQRMIAQEINYAYKTVTKKIKERKFKRIVLPEIINISDDRGNVVDSKFDLS